MAHRGSEWVEIFINTNSPFRKGGVGGIWRCMVMVMLSYNKNQKQFAENFEKNMVDAERLLYVTNLCNYVKNMERVMIHKISPNPSLPKRGTKRKAEIFIINLLDYMKRQYYFDVPPCRRRFSLFSCPKSVIGHPEIA